MIFFTDGLGKVDHLSSDTAVGVSWYKIDKNESNKIMSILLNYKNESADLLLHLLLRG